MQLIWQLHIAINLKIFKIKQLRKDKNKMENQEILIPKIKNRKRYPKQKIKKGRRQKSNKVYIIL